MEFFFKLNRSFTSFRHVFFYSPRSGSCSPRLRSSAWASHHPSLRTAFRDLVSLRRQFHQKPDPAHPPLVAFVLLLRCLSISVSVSSLPCKEKRCSSLSPPGTVLVPARVASLALRDTLDRIPKSAPWFAFLLTRAYFVRSRDRSCRSFVTPSPHAGSSAGTCVYARLAGRVALRVCHAFCDRRSSSYKKTRQTLAVNGRSPPPSSFLLWLSVSPASLNARWRAHTPSDLAPLSLRQILGRFLRSLKAVFPFFPPHPFISVRSSPSFRGDF